MAAARAMAVEPPGPRLQVPEELPRRSNGFEARRAPRPVSMLSRATTPEALSPFETRLLKKLGVATPARKEQGHSRSLARLPELPCFERGQKRSQNSARLMLCPGNAVSVARHYASSAGCVTAEVTFPRSLSAASTLSRTFPSLDHLELSGPTSPLGDIMLAGTAASLADPCRAASSGAAPRDRAVLPEGEAEPAGAPSGGAVEAAPNGASSAPTLQGSRSPEHWHRLQKRPGRLGTE
eukprot:CAMPEP_0180460374 /NCGR_PEP_ID=MMETSP1036_2-20121128/23334_1 /TAXON_ID=632150 /ORGANISM="Azadinium spinosum, Strain 3D9" /LENGTH=237 /DNA_ID=CAMNT_0022467069 /DNA_START=82 /DNA_END=792 /DNA_ORIENTATION=+